MRTFRDHPGYIVGAVAALIILGAIGVLASAGMPAPTPPPTPPVAIVATPAPTASPSITPTASPTPTTCYYNGKAYDCDSPVPTDGPTPKPTPAPPTPRPLPNKTLLNKSSSDSHIIGFTIPAADDYLYGLLLTFSYRCSGSGNFIINSYDGPSADDVTDPFYVNELDDHGSGSIDGTDGLWPAGTYRLQVISECRWTIKVTAIPSPPD